MSDDPRASMTFCHICADAPCRCQRNSDAFAKIEDALEELRGAVFKRDSNPSPARKWAAEHMGIHPLSLNEATARVYLDHPDVRDQVPGRLKPMVIPNTDGDTFAADALDAWPVGDPLADMRAAIKDMKPVPTHECAECSKRTVLVVVAKDSKIVCSFECWLKSYGYKLGPEGLAGPVEKI